MTCAKVKGFAHEGGRKLRIVETKDISVKINGREMQYVYRLLVKDYNNKKVYGLEVERRDINNNQIVNIERENIEKISSVKSKVKEMLDILYKGIVSPIHVVDISGEEIDKCIAEI